MAAMWLDDGEFFEFLRDLYTVVQPRLVNPPRTGRNRRILATVLLPADPAPATPPNTASGETPS